MRTLTESQIERLSDAASAITTCFDWDESREGYDYWSAVFENLQKLVHEANKCPTCEGTGKVYDG